MLDVSGELVLLTCESLQVYHLFVVSQKTSLRTDTSFRNKFEFEFYLPDVVPAI